MRVLVTGASGYLGLHLTRRLLADGHEVTAFVRSAERLGALAQDAALTAVEGDLLDTSRVTDAVAGNEVCVHAGFVWGEPETDLDLLDSRAGARLFDAAGAAGARRTVLISSTAVHRPFTARMGEDDALTPTDVYGATKAATETLLWPACAGHDMEGVVLRPGPIVGPPALAGAAFKSDGRISGFVAAARRGDPLEVVGGAGRQFVAAEDVARAVAVAIDESSPPGTYLCVDREITTWESIARRAVTVAGSSSEVIVAAPASDGPAPRFSDDRLAALLGGSLDSRDAMERHLAHLAGRPSVG